MADDPRLEDELATLLEQEWFEPPESFVRDALITDMSVHEAAERDPVGWWEEQARALDWFEPWTRGLDDDDAPFYRWFSGGKLNVSHNCLDRHVEAGLGERVAFHWHGEEGERRDITYAQLLADVQRCANALKARGIGAGDVVGIYLPMIPEVVVAMLACTRIGAPHNVVFGGFSAESVHERMVFSNATALITVDGGRRKGKTAPVKTEVDAVMGNVTHLETILVVRHSGAPCEMREGRDIWWHEALEAADPVCPAEPLDAEHPLFILYSSGLDGEAEGHPAHDRRLPDRRGVDVQARLRPQARERRLLVHGRRRLDHRPQLHRLRPARARRDVRDVRGRPGLPRQGRLVAAVRAVRRHDLLHRADGDPHLHEVGRRVRAAP